MQYQQQEKTNQKSLNIVFCGAPNVGKSTLLNRILGCKLAISSSKPQTTRFNIKGVLTKDDTQLVIIDTPGIFRPKLSQLEKQIVKEAWQGLCGVDLICLIIDAKKGFDGSAKKIVEKTAENGLPMIVVCNKSDLLSLDQKVILANQLNSVGRFSEIFFLSAKNGKGCDALVKYFLQNAVLREWQFDEDALTDKDNNFIASEFVREQLFRILSKELPYMLSCETDFFEEDENEISISVVIKIGKENHKKMILGAGGSNLKKIIHNSSVNLEKIFGKHVKLKIFVKMVKNN